MPHTFDAYDILAIHCAFNILYYLPADWKVANITPVFKKGDCTKPENY
jgi:hypothetical protein